MAILGVLWAQGPNTVRAVHGVLEPERGIGYTTVLKLLQIMLDKGLVRRDTTQRSHVYEAAVDRTAIQEALVGDLTDKAFGGSTASLVMRALSPERASAGEIAEIRAWLDQLEKAGES